MLKKTTSEDDRSGRRVLIVEDEFYIAQSVVTAFEEAGAKVLGPAPSISKALDLIASTPTIDGVVLDLNLHGELAYAVLDEVLARRVPLVFTTGYDTKSIPDRYASVVCCAKPYDVGQVVEALFDQMQSRDAGPALART